MTPRHFLVLFNPRSGSTTPELRARIEEVLSAAGSCRIVDVPEEGDVGPTLVAIAASESITHLVAAGGDGTVNALLELARAHRLPILPLPLGTSSSIPMALGIRDVEHGLTLATDPAAEHRRDIDVAWVNGQPMVLVAAIGLHADAIGSTDPGLKAAVGPAAYVAWFAGAVARGDHFDVEIETGGARFSCATCAVTVANIARAGAIFAQGTGDVRADDGLLDVTIVLATSTTEMIAAGIELVQSVLSGEGVEGRSVLAFRASSLVLRPTTPRPLLVDGELVGEPSEVRIELVPGALSVIAPAPEP